jgi:nucleolar protein 15
LQKKTKKNSATEAEAEGKTTKKTRKYINKRGVVYIGHLPHGFYEEELKKFFSQFGEVSRVKVSRSCRVRIQHNIKHNVC